MPTSETQNTTSVGAGVAEPLESHFLYHDHLIKWIAETKQKLPNATPKLREEAFLADPLLKGTIFPYLKNVLLQGFTIQTADNKLYAQAISDITDYLEYLELMQVFRDDFLDFAFLTGHTYRRIDIDKDKRIAHLEKIEPSTVTTYEDSWDSSIKAYHQRALVNPSWSSMGIRTEYNSWFIPYGELDNYATWIQDRGTGNNLRVLDLFATYKAKYGIADITNLRIASAERIIAMHNTDINNVRNGYYDDYCELRYGHAPIDSVLLAIWLKRLLLVNSPNLIFIILSPFLHLKMGIIEKIRDFSGNEHLESTLPKMPQPGSPTYDAEQANYTAFENALKESMKTLLRCLKEGGVYATGADQELKPIESSRNASFQLIKGLIDNLNEEIGLNFGFPMSLVLATGTELASSRNILQIFNSVHAGERSEYEAVANKLINKMFEGHTWTGDEGTYAFEDIKARFELDIPDTKDLLSEAQTFKTYSETLTNVKTLGASQEDLQALGEEYGFGLLGLDNYEAPASQQQPITDDQAAQMNAILKSLFFGAPLGSAVSPTAPSNFDEEKIVKQLKDAYEEGKNTIEKLFEEH